MRIESAAGIFSPIAEVNRVDWIELGILSNRREYTAEGVAGISVVRLSTKAVVVGKRIAEVLERKSISVTVDEPER